jgi:hypothetical protein
MYVKTFKYQISSKFFQLFTSYYILPEGETGTENPVAEFKPLACT